MPDDIPDDILREGIRQARRKFDHLSEAERRDLVALQEQHIDEGVHVVRKALAAVNAIVALRGITHEQATGEYILDLMRGMEADRAKFFFDGLTAEVQGFVRAAEALRRSEGA